MTSNNINFYVGYNPLILCSNLTIPQNIRFGIEIELEDVEIVTVRKALNTYSGW